MELPRPTTIEINDRKFPIEWGKAIAMLGGFGAKEGYEFEVAHAGDQEIGFYHLPAGRTTRVVKIVKEVNCTERLIQGEGWFLRALANGGGVEWRSFDADAGRVSEVGYGLGDTIMWGAGKKEARILTIADRPFTDDMETSVALSAATLPVGFLRKLEEFTRNVRP